MGREGRGEGGVVGQFVLLGVLLAVPRVGGKSRGGCGGLEG
ncbi:MAG: hypothetical protein U0232_16745 [Thermomicrobiales bacterium]